MKRFWTLALGISLLGMGTLAQAQEARKPKAILFMLDGMRADGIDNARMPNVKKLMTGTWQPGYNGAWSLTGQTVPDARPSSAANHAAIATGVNAAKNKVFNNGETAKGNYAEWPSWLGRLADANPDIKTLFMYSWGENKDTAKHPKVQFIKGSDADNGKVMPQLLAQPDAPDAILYFIDMPDAGGHGTGFYPYGPGFLRNAYLSDVIIGNVLNAIASRPSFANEDWLIMVTGDHGGYHTGHGMWGGHATTVPVIMASRHIDSGRLIGLPRHYDLTATALAHFGLEVPAMNLDASVLTKTVTDAVRSLRDGLAVYLPFGGKTPDNAVKDGPKPAVLGPGTASGCGGGFAGNCLRIAGGENVPGGLCLTGSESLKYENGNDFTMTMWVRMSKEQAGDPAIVSNKNWQNGKLPGIVMCGARKSENAKALGVCFNAGLDSEKMRLDIGTFDIDYGKWVFYAVTRNAEGVLTFYQGANDGRLYWIAEHAEDIRLNSGMPLHIGQDGTGAYKWTFNGDLDDFALWTRSMSKDDIRGIYEAGRLGMELDDLLK